MRSLRRSAVRICAYYSCNEEDKKVKVLWKRAVCLGLVLSLLAVLFAASLPVHTEATEQTLSAGVRNIVKRAKQMTQIQWTPVKNITGWGGGVTYTAGKTYTGLPYGQPVYASYVPWSTSLEKFLDAVNDPASKMYTSSSTYNKEAPYYSVDCSAFVSWAWGLSSRQTTSTIANFATKISTSSYKEAQVGDCLCLAGSHVVLITDITYDSLGAINGIEISESTTNSATYYCCQVTRYGVNGTYSLSDLVSKYFSKGYILYRSKTRDSVTYTHSCAIPLEGDVCAKCNPIDGKEKMVSAQVTALENVTLYSLPSAGSGKLGTVTSGTAIEIAAYLEDSTGAVWYKTVNGSWLDSAQTRFDFYLKTASIAGQVFPQGDLTLGAQFLLKGTVTAKNPIVSITASILAGDEVEQQISFGFDGIAAYTIDGSELDDEMCFGELAEGSYTFRLTVLEEGTCPAGGVQKIKTLWNTAFTVASSGCAHIYIGSVLSGASCEAPGVIRYTCSECGAYYDKLTDTLGHDYVAEVISATCVDYGKTVYTCNRCQDSYIEYVDGTYTDWTELKPTDVDENLIETKTQYRYSEYETITSTDKTMSGWELVSSAWNQTGTGSVQYAASWPAGFSTKHSLYTAYNNTAVVATETATAKTTINSDAVTGYLYYHWCRGTYTEGPINRKAKATMQDDCVVFHAFFSTVAPGTMEMAADGGVVYPNAECCTDSHWYYNTPVNTQTYTTYENVFTYGRWADWSAWTDEEYTEDEMCKVESRTLYRVISGQLGDHSWEGGTCTVCGANDPDYAVPTLAGSGFTLSFEDEILINFYFTAENVDVSAENMGMLVFSQEPAAVDIAYADAVYEGAVEVSSNGTFMNQTDGIPAKKMGDSNYYAAYAKLADGSYLYSRAYEYSPKKYAYNILAKTTASEKQKALCVAMLNYGTAAQLYFDYHTDDLMNDALTEAQKNMVVAYSADLFTGPVKADSNKIGKFAATEQSFSQRTASVSFDGALAINYYFGPNAQVNGDITFYYWSAADYASAAALTTANAAGSCSMVKMNDGSYWAQVSGIAAKEIDDTYYVAAVYSSSGDTLCSGVIAYSLSKYCINHAKDGDVMQELAAATAMYGYYAKAYFSN
jgi:hypothetical protein